MAGDGSAASRAIWTIAPYFVVDDVVATANFYRDTLGFSYERFWGDPPRFCMVKRGGIIIMLGQLEQPRVARPNNRIDPDAELWDAYVWVVDADALHEEFRRRGAKIVRDIIDQPYGNRDFDVEDCNGYRLCFGSDLPNR